MMLLQQLRGPIGAWRGHAPAHWGIDSSPARRYRNEHARLQRPLTERNVRAVETQLVERARGAGHGDGLGELELLARMQHHGAATRRRYDEAELARNLAYTPLRACA